MKSKKLIKSITKHSILFFVLALICISTTFVQAQPTAGSTGIGFVDHASNLDSVPSGYVSFYSDNVNILVGHRPYDSQVSQIKASSPNTLCFAYKLQVRKTPIGEDDVNHGIGSFSYVASQGESWFLHYDDGNPPSENNRAADPYNPTNFWYNIGNPDVRTYVANTLVNELANLSWDGVFLDCIYTFGNSETPTIGGQAIQEYSIGSAWNMALVGWVQAVYDAFNTYNASHSHKLYVIVNTTGVWQIDSAISKAYSNVCYAQLWEDFIGLYNWKPAERYLSESRWNTQMEVAEDAASKGAGIFACSHYKSDVPADSRHDIIYGKGSLMLVTDGNAQKFVLSPYTHFNFEENYSVYNSFSDILRYDIGTPAGSRYQSNGVWLRNFSGGKVVVNPTPDNQGTLQLGGSYTDFATGNTVTSISLTANTAWLLASQEAAPQNIFTTQVPGYFGNDVQYELGTKFKANVAGQITKVRIYAGPSEGGSHIVRIWRVSDFTVAAGPYTWNITSGTEGWKDYTLPTPLSITANTDYIVSVSNSSSDKYYACTGGGFNSPIDNGNLITYTGSGVYTTTLGSMPTSVANNGNYYRDVYFVPNTAQNIFATQVPGYFGNEAQYELGTKFKANAAGQITKVRIYAGPSEGGSHTVRIWRVSNSTVVAGPYTWNITTGTAGWKDYTLPTPLSITANTDYIVSVSNSSSDKYYACTGGGFNSPINNGNLITYTGSGVYTTTLGNMPTTVANNGNYYRDVYFVPD